MSNLGGENTSVEGQDFSLPAGAQFAEDNGDLVIEDSAGNIVFRRDEANDAWNIDGVFDGENLTAPVDNESVSTEGINNSVEVLSEHDFKSRIESQPSGTKFELEAGASWTVTNGTVTFPDNHLVIAQDNTVTKGFDGTLAEVGDDSYIFGGLEFDGNKANHTGDGVADAYNDPLRCWWMGVEIYNCAGNGRVHNARSRARYPNCRFYLNDGYGVREMAESNPTDRRCRHIQYPNTYISDNGLGGVKWDTPIENYRFGARMSGNGGACIEADAGSYNYQDVELFPRIQNGDGPFYYQSSGDAKSLRVTGGIIQDTNQDIANTPMSGSYTSSLGQIHFEGGSVTRFHISGGNHKAGGADTQAFIAAHTGTIENVLITGGIDPGGEKLEGSNMEVELYGQDGNSWNMTLDVDGGLVTGHNANGISYWRDLGKDSTRYFGWSGNEPNPDSSLAVYFDTGNLTGDGNPGFRWTNDGGSTWNDLN